MTRRSVAIALVAATSMAIALVPGAAAHFIAMPHDGYSLRPGEHRDVPLHLEDSTKFVVEVESDTAVDIIILLATTPAQYYAGTTPLAQILNVTTANLTVHVVGTGEHSVLIDNTPYPGGGAFGMQNATVHLRIWYDGEHGDDPGGPLWPTLMFRAPYWNLGGVGFGGVALWVLVIACACLIWMRTPRVKLIILALGTTVAATLWGLLPHPGAMTSVGLPMLIGAAVAWRASRGTDVAVESLKMAGGAAALGFLAGAVLTHFILNLAGDPGMPVLGGGRFGDAIFVGPLAAALGVVLMRGVPAFVEAMETDEAASATAATAGQGLSFKVNCTRCGTPITVDRSMKRYRVATDRFEFNCPNCQASMEWAEPKAPQGV